MPDIPLRIKNKLISLLTKETSVEAAILFGSRARGDAKQNSDIDIALVGSNIPIGIKTRIRDTAGLYPIDIVILSELDNKQLLANIERDGIVLYTRENAAAITF